MNLANRVNLIYRKTVKPRLCELCGGLRRGNASPALIVTLHPDGTPLDCTFVTPEQKSRPCVGGMFPTVCPRCGRRLRVFILAPMEAVALLGQDYALNFTPDGKGGYQRKDHHDAEKQD